MKVGWQTKTIGEVCDIINGSTPLRSNKAYWENGNINWFTIEDIREQGRKINRTNQKITHHALEKTSVRILPSKSVLLCCTASIGEYAITEAPMATNQQFNGLVVKNQQTLEPLFLFHFCATMKDKLAELSGKTTIDFIPISRLRDILIPVPPIPEQQRIVTILDEAFEGIAIATANAEKNLANARELFESYLQSIFTNRANDWDLKSIGSVIKLEYGKPLDRADRTNNGQYPVYGANGEKSRTSKFYYDKESIIVGRKGSAGEINLSEEKFWPLDVTYFVTYDNNQNELMFLYYLLGSLKLPLLAKGVKPGINRNEVYALTARFPDLATQKTTVAKLGELSAEIKGLEAIYQQKLMTLDELKKSLLNRAFAGELTHV